MAHTLRISIFSIIIIIIIFFLRKTRPKRISVQNILYSSVFYNLNFHTLAKKKKIISFQLEKNKHTLPNKAKTSLQIIFMRLNINRQLKRNGIFEKPSRHGD